jgi:lipopolysaccharide transport system ATP-binding protein
MYGAILGLPREEVDRRFDEIAAFADIGEFIDRPMKTYSSGMIVRLAFAVSACVDPDILIVDEALAVGDAAFQRKCFRHLEGIIARGAVVLFVSHDVESVKRFCQRAIWLADGQVRQIGSAKAVCEAYERFLLGHDPADAREPAESAAAVPAPAPPAAALLDPNLVIAAPVQYGGYAAVIEQLWITDGAGKTVNVVPEVIDFTVNYRIRFKEACRKVWFGMTVKTVDGIAVYAAHTVDRHAPSDFHAGEAVHIRFALKNGLAPGTYFLNCGANHETPRGRDVLHRLLDATILRVSSEPGPLRYGGIANLKAQVSIERVEPTP